MTRPADTIRDEMQQLRGEIAKDMDEVVESTREMTDWRSYVKRTPWLCLGAAAAAGFLLVPRRTKTVTASAETLLELARQQQLVVQPDAKVVAKPGVSRLLFGMLARTAVQSGLSLLSQQFANANSRASSDDDA